MSLLPPNAKITKGNNHANRTSSSLHTERESGALPSHPERSDRAKRHSENHEIPGHAIFGHVRKISGYCVYGKDVARTLNFRRHAEARIERIGKSGLKVSGVPGQRQNQAWNNGQHQRPRATARACPQINEWRQSEDRKADLQQQSQSAQHAKPHSGTVTLQPVRFDQHAHRRGQ